MKNKSVILSLQNNLLIAVIIIVWSRKCESMFESNCNVRLLEVILKPGCGCLISFCINPRAPELFVSIFHSFEARVAYQFPASNDEKYSVYIEY